MTRFALTIVAPCYNEADVLPEFYRRTTAACAKAADSYEIVFVNDGSSDGTRGLLRSFAATDPHVDAPATYQVPLAARKALGDEIGRVLKPGAYCRIFERNPWNPVTRAIVRRCPVDRTAVLLSLPEAVCTLGQSGFGVRRRVLPLSAGNALPEVPPAGAVVITTSAWRAVRRTVPPRGLKGRPARSQLMLDPAEPVFDLVRARRMGWREDTPWASERSMCASRPGTGVIVCARCPMSLITEVGAPTGSTVRRLRSRKERW